jgi:hypothetical protein
MDSIFTGPEPWNGMSILRCMQDTENWGTMYVLYTGTDAGICTLPICGRSFDVLCWLAGALSLPRDYTTATPSPEKSVLYDFRTQMSRFHSWPASTHLSLSLLSLHLVIGRRIPARGSATLKSILSRLVYLSCKTQRLHPRVRILWGDLCL